MATRWITGTIAAAAVVLTGCASTGAGNGDQMRNTVYSTHRTVQNLDENLGSSISKLNESNAELVARIDASENETRRLASMVEENQVKLDNLQQRLKELTTTLYRHFDLTPPPDAGSREPDPSMSPSAPDGPSVGVNVDPNGGGEGNSGMQEREPDPAPAPRGQAQRQQQQRQEQREQAQQQERQQQPSDPTAYYREAIELYMNEDLAAARDRFASYLELFPDTGRAADAQYWKAHCSYSLGEYETAITEFRKLRETYPDSAKVPTAMHNQAVAFHKLGEVERAKSLFRQLIAEYPDDVATEGARKKLQQLEGN